MSHTHIAFSDESGHGSGRYRSLALVTFSAQNLDPFQKEVSEMLLESNIVDEFKWEKLRSAKYKFAAEKLHAFAFKKNDQIRIDVLIWDTLDSRNKDVSGRDDNANMGRMYYHLLQNVLSSRWPAGSKWHWQPDTQSAMDWGMIGNCLITKKYKSVSGLFCTNESDFLRLGLKEITVCESHKEPFIQLADLYAGLGVYSYNSFENYKKWQASTSGQGSLFSSGVEIYKPSNAEMHRFPVIEKVVSDCKNLKLPISFESSRGFKTHDPKAFINFWVYEPQHHLDKAPTKAGRQ